MRRRLVSQLVKSGSVPEDPKEAKVFLTALADMDRQVLTTKKIAADKDNGNKAVAMAAMISGIFNDPRTKILQSNPASKKCRQKRSVVLDSAIVPSVIVPGELGPHWDFKKILKHS